MPRASRGSPQQSAEAIPITLVNLLFFVLLPHMRKSGTFGVGELAEGEKTAFGTTVAVIARRHIAFVFRGT